MGKFINEKLAQNEYVVGETVVHWSIFVSPIFVILFGLIFSLVAGDLVVFILKSFNPDFFGDKTQTVVLYAKKAGALIIVIGVLSTAWAWLKRATSEFAVTNKRIFVKTGVISRFSFNINLGKVESLQIEQSVVERIIGSGKMAIIGSGSTPQIFKNINSPFDFQMAVNEALELWNTIA
jgi:uncharacterized membrane protein YdbT with pleckstrin-like domain